MGKITAIEACPRNKSRFAITVDGEAWGTLDKISIKKGSLHVGDAITSHAWETLARDAEAEAAYERALFYLDRGRRTQKQMLVYLARKGFSESATQSATNKLLDYRYIDDEEFSQELVRQATQHNKLGRRAIQSKLWQKGVERDVIDDALSAYQPEDELENAIHLGRKIAARPCTDPQKARRRLVQGLQARGFSWELIQQVMEKLAAEDDDNTGE